MQQETERRIVVVRGHHLKREHDLAKGVYTMAQAALHVFPEGGCSYRSLYLDKDESVLIALAKQMVHQGGVHSAAHIASIGPLAKRFVQLWTKEAKALDKETGKGPVHLYVVDRQCDPAPLLFGKERAERMSETDLLRYLQVELLLHADKRAASKEIFRLLCLYSLTHKKPVRPAFVNALLQVSMHDFAQGLLFLSRHLAIII